MTITSKEMAQEIRQQLKSQGITSRQVSVKSGICGYNDYIHATIKTATVDIDEVKKIVSMYSSVDRDERTGEILAGGNTYTTVEYADGAFEGLVDSYKSTALNLLKNMENKSNWEGQYIAENLYLFKNGNGYEVIYNHTERKWIFSCFGLAKLLYMWNTHGHI